MRIKSFYATAVAAVFAVAAFSAATPTLAVPIEWVRVGDPNNPADSTGYGSVGHTFDIMKFEFTNEQYTAFLNAIDPQGTNPNGVYFNSMGTAKIGGITNTGTVDGSRYAVRPNKANKPVSYVTWFDAARVVNWIQNGAQTYAGTDDTAAAPQNNGAYTVGTAVTGDAPARNPNATFWIPTENEWYKTAFYNQSLNEGTGGYTLYGNGFNETPGTVTANSVGDGSAGSVGNFANWQQAAVWQGNLPVNTASSANVTTVGTNGAASYYGAFDMSGNLYEWNDLTGGVGLRGWRGGAWNIGSGSPQILSSAFRTDTVEPGFDNSNVIGFRIATVPEPSTGIALISGVGCIGYWGLRRSRKARKAAAEGSLAEAV